MGEWRRCSSSGDEKSPSLQRINPISSPHCLATILAPMYRMCLPKFAHYIMWGTELPIQKGTYILPPAQISWELKCQCVKATCNNCKGETHHYMIGVTYMDVLSASVKEATSWAAMPSPWDTRPKMDTHRILQQHVMLITDCLRSQPTDTQLLKKFPLSWVLPEPDESRPYLLKIFPSTHRSSKWLNLFRFLMSVTCLINSFPLICSL